MMRRRTLTSKPITPMKPIRVVIEDAELAAASTAIDAPGCMDVRICSGPASSAEICPLVVDGTCPLGPADVVVTSLDGPWAPSVAAAWREKGVLAAAPPSGEFPPEARVRAHLGAAYQALFTPRS